MDIDELLGMAERALMIAEREVDEAEVFIIRNHGTSLSIEKDRIKSITGGGETGIALRVLVNRRMGFAYCSSIEGVKDALKQAVQVAALAPEKPFEFPAGQDFRTVPDLLDRQVLELTPENAVEFASSMIEAAGEANPDISVTGGGVGFGEEEVVLMNSAGLEVSEHLSEMNASVYTVMKTDRPSSGFESEVSHLHFTDFEEIGQKAAELAVRGQNPVKIEGGQMPVVLRPEALSGLLEFILVPALYGINAGKGESVYTDRLNEEIAHPDFSVVDDPTMPDGMNAMKMDDEGVPSRRVALIQKGVLKEYLYTIATGAEFGMPSTSSGLRAGRFSSSHSHTSPVSTSGRNIIIEGNTKEEERLISEIDKGLLIYDLMGAHTSNPASGDFSVTCSILFRIEKGEITAPVSQAMLSGNFPEYLRDVSGIGNNYRRMPGGLTPMGFYIPSIRLEDVKVTGER